MKIQSHNKIKEKLEIRDDKDTVKEIIHYTRKY